MTRFVVALLLAAPAFAQDQVWTWTDDKGEEHYTNDKGSIPEKYRSKIRSTVGQELSVVKPSDGYEPAPTPAPTPVAKPVTPPAPTPVRAPNGAVKVVLFEASTSSASKTLKKAGVIEKLLADNPGLTLERVEFATAVDRAEKLGVTQLPTVLFVDGSGTVLVRATGLVTLKDLQGKLDKARGTSE